MFEASMQAVDPSVSLPYWDFTIDNEAGQSIFDSFMFQDSTFGTLKAPSNGYYWTYEDDSIEDGIISDGRWASIKADDSRFDDIPSPFGYMRGEFRLLPYFIFHAYFCSRGMQLIMDMIVC
jgi:hypothetical protein